MKFTLSFLVIIALSTSAFAQIVDFPDENFKNALVNQTVVIDTNGDGEIQISEAENATLILTTGEGITDITGVEAFINLETLDCSSNLIESVDLSQNTSLDDIRLGGNLLTTLDLSNNLNLERLNLISNPLTEINLAANINLKRLDVNGTQINELNLSSNTALELLSFSNTLLTEINLTGLSELKSLSFGGADSLIDDIDLSDNVLLEVLTFRGTDIESINLDANINLKLVDIGFNEIQSIDLAQNSQITALTISGNPISTIDVSNLELLQAMSFNFTDLETIDLSMNPVLCFVTGNGCENLTNVNIKNGNNAVFTGNNTCSVSAFAVSGSYPNSVGFSASDNIETICVDNIDFAEENFIGVINTAEFLEDCSLSTEDVSYSQITVYPNPTQGKITISQTVKGITIYDLSGRLIYKGTKNTVSLSDLPNGVYLLKLDTDEGLISKKIIKRS